MITVFADLDDTLFQTQRKLRGDEGELTPATLRADSDEPHSFMTPAQARLLALLGAPGITVIPVTGRDASAMSRVLLPFTSWVVLDHGLTILEPGGAVHRPWAETVLAALTPHAAALDALQAGALDLAQLHGLRLSVHAAHAAPFMLVAKHPDAEPRGLAAVQDLWTRATHGTGLHVIANANNVSVLPHALGKRAAVEYLQGTLPPAALTLGLGDSVSDLGFLAACDFAVTPSRGQLIRAVLAAELPQQ